MVGGRRSCCRMALQEYFKEVIVTHMYTCPMHQEVRQEKPGLCFEWGMSLILAKEKEVHREHGKHAGHKTDLFLKKFWISLKKWNIKFLCFLSKIYSQKKNFEIGGHIFHG